MADVEEFEIAAAFDNGFDARASHSYAAADAQVAEFEKVQGNTTQGCVGDSGAAESEVEMGQRGKAKG